MIEIASTVDPRAAPTTYALVIRRSKSLLSNYIYPGNFCGSIARPKIEVSRAIPANVANPEMRSLFGELRSLKITKSYNWAP